MSKENKKWADLIFKIMKAIYWRTLTNKEEKALISIIEDNKFDTHDKANLMCEYLQIQKRGNRQAISDVLESDELLNQLNNSK